MDKEQITKILSKIKDTVGENNYKLALAITGHRTGKIKDIIMCSKDGELLLEYVEQLEQQCKQQKEVIDKAVNDIQEIIDAVNKNTIIAMKQFNFKLEIIQDELGGSNDILNEVSE